MNCFHCDKDITNQPKTMMSVDREQVRSQKFNYLCGNCDAKYWEAVWADKKIANEEARKNYARVVLENKHLAYKLNKIPKFIQKLFR